MALLTREQIEAAKSNSRKWEDVPVPEWGPDAEVRIMELTAADRGYVEAGQIVANDSNPKLKVDSLKTYRQKMVAAGLVDENGVRLYAWKDLPLLDDFGGAVLERLCDVALRLSGMGRHAVKKAEGNSDAGTTDSSSSDSPSTSD
jgi:hypothetical protein